MQIRNLFISSLLIVSTFLNALPAAAQTKAPIKPTATVKTRVAILTDPSEIFSAAKKDDGTFGEALAKMIGGSTDAADALDAQSPYFYDQIRESTKDQLQQTGVKASEAVKKSYDRLRSAKRAPGKNGPVKPVPPANAPVKPIPTRKATIKYDAPRNIQGAGGLFRNAAYSADESTGPAIKRVESETGIDITAAETKTIDTGEGIITRTATGDSNINFDGRKFSISLEMGEKADAALKTGNQRLTKEFKMDWKVDLDACPDAEGIIRGTGRAHLFIKTTINTGRDLAAISLDTEVLVSVIGYVNDDAQMTHWDMEGSISETAFGFDRAIDHGLVQDKGIRDGKLGFTFEAKDGTPPRTTENPQTHWKSTDPAKMGELVPLTGDLPGNSGERIGKAGGAGLSGTIDRLNDLMRTSESRWRNQECVDVECKAAKTALKPGEAIDVEATTVSKQDLAKVNSPNMNAGGTESVTPENQAGQPTAVYTLTAPKEGEASIVVTSTSRRGIGIGTLDIPVVKPKKKPPVKPVPPKKVVDPIWTGTIKAVHTQYEVLEGLPSARMTKDHYSKDEKWEVSLSVPGTRDLSGGIINNFHAETEVVYSGVDYKEKVYVPGAMSCNRHGPIITSGQTQKFTLEDKGAGKATMLVGIAIYNGRGTISFGAPESIAKRHTIIVYESACAEYNRTNSYNGIEPNPLMVGSPSFEVSFDIDPAKPDEVSGTKTVLNDNGSKTVYSWNLSRVK